MKPDKLESWFNDALQGITDDAQKAEVLKAHIQERGETARARVTDRTFVENRAIVHGIAVVALGIVGLGICIASCQASDNHKAVEMERIHGEHPGAFAPPAPAASTK